MMSPTCSVPRWTSTVPTGPRPRSSLASMITPSAARSGLALSSSTSACSSDRFEQLVEADLLQRRDLDLERVAAQAFDDDLVAEASSVRTRCGSASGLSILLMATMIGTPAALA